MSPYSVGTPRVSRLTVTGEARPGSLSDPVVCGKESRTVLTVQNAAAPTPSTSRVASPIATKMRRRLLPAVRPFSLTGMPVLLEPAEHLLEQP